jgi:hypothetical protein
MTKAGWQVVPGMGEQLLKGIGQEARLWNRFANRSDYLAERVERLQENSSSMVQKVIDSAVMEGDLTDFESLAHRLDGSQRWEIIRAQLASAAMKRLTSLGQGLTLGQGNRARLTVMKSGVHAKRLMSWQEPLPELLASSPQLEVDRVVEGTMYDLRSSPKLGGLLGLKAMFLNTYIHGLVNPATGDPRVNLEVFARPETD